MTYPIDTEKERGIDDDLIACLEYNPQKFDVGDIVKVLAVWEGERDVEDWRWIIELPYGYVFLQGWCDYTGWDCQSGARSMLETSVERAIAQAVIAHTTFQSLTAKIIVDLLYQVLHGKGKTWREKKNEEFKAMKIQGMAESAYLTGGPKPGLELQILAKPEHGEKGSNVDIVARYAKFPLIIEVVTTKGYEERYKAPDTLKPYYIDCGKSWLSKLDNDQARDLAALLENAAQIVTVLMGKDGKSES